MRFLKMLYNILYSFIIYNYVNCRSPWAGVTKVLCRNLLWLRLKSLTKTKRTGVLLAFVNEL